MTSAPRARLVVLPLVAALLALSSCGADSDSVSPKERTARQSLSSEHRSGQRGLVSPRRGARAVARFRRLGRPVYCGAGTHRYVAMTFDDGPSTQTREILRILRRSDARATFFLVGSQVLKRKRLVNSQVLLGSVGDHTWSHPALTRMTAKGARREVERTKRLLDKSRGRIDLFRPPYGARDKGIDAMVRRNGMLPVMWSLDSEDSAGDVGWRYVARTVLRNVRPGSIVLMHENQPETPRALARILPQLRARGFKFVTVPELLALDPPSTKQVRRGLMGCKR
jgi:peptidoglycan/xylan/chitin deacetylase (PgdA/CDA1 family)